MEHVLKKLNFVEHCPAHNHKIAWRKGFTCVILNNGLVSVGHDIKGIKSRLHKANNEQHLIELISYFNRI